MMAKRKRQIRTIEQLPSAKKLAAAAKARLAKELEAKRRAQEAKDRRANEEKLAPQNNVHVTTTAPVTLNGMDYGAGDRIVIPPSMYERLKVEHPNIVDKFIPNEPIPQTFMGVEIHVDPALEEDQFVIIAADTAKSIAKEFHKRMNFPKNYKYDFRN